MPRTHTVILSINRDDQSRCVDVFTRADNTFGFEEYRRDSEDARGWFPIGGYSRLVFATREDAFAEARASIGWFGER